MVAAGESELLWAAFARTGSPGLRDRLIREYVPFVHYVASRYHSIPGGIVQLEDLVGYGMIGLIDAVDRFDPERGVPFEGFAARRIRGAIQDELRRVDWVPRRLRKSVSKLRRAGVPGRVPAGRARLAGGSGPPDIPGSAPLAEFGASQRLLAELPLRRTVPLEEPGSPRRDVPDATEGPAAATERREVRRLLEASIAELTLRERTVLHMSYAQGRTLLEIAAELGVTQGRVCQIRQHALARLRRRLERAGVTHGTPVDGTDGLPTRAVS